MSSFEEIFLQWWENISLWQTKWQTELERLCHSLWRGSPQQPPQHSQSTPTILCLNKDITSFKEIIYWEVWVDHRQGSQRDFSHFAFINLEKESISGKGVCSQWKWKGWGCSLLTVVRAGSRVSLAASQRFLSHLHTAWPWSVLLFYNRARVIGREVT